MIKQWNVVILLIIVGRCSAQEILDPPVAVHIGEYTLIGKVAPKGFYSAYEIKLYDSSGALIQVESTDALFTFDSLNTGANYTVTAAVKTLANGTDINGTASNALSIRTKAIRILTVVRVDLTYSSQMSDPASTEFLSLSNSIREDLKATYPFIEKVEVLYAYDTGDAVGAFVETEKDSDTGVDTSLSSANTTLSFTGLTTVGTPTLNPITEVTSSGFQISWSSTSALRSVVYVDCDGNSSIYVTDSSVKTYTVTLLEPLTTCYVRVRSIVSTERVSGISNRNTVSTLPSGVPNLEIIALSYRSIRVKFGYVVSGESYSITVNDSKSTTATVSGTEISNDSFSRDISLEDIGGTFIVSVNVTVNGETGESSNGTVTLVEAVSGLLIYNVTEDGFDVLFEKVLLQGGTLVESYQIKYDSNTTNETTFTTQDNEVHINKSPVDETFRVTAAYTASGETSPDTEYVDTDVYTIGRVTATSIELSWKEVPRENEYTVSRLPTTVEPDILRTNSTTFTNLSPGTTYQLTVSYYSSALNDALTYFKVSRLTVPGKITGLNFSPDNISCFGVSWNSADGVTAYNLTVTPESSDHTIRIDDASSNAEVCGVNTGDLYNVTVSGTNDAGSGESALLIGCHSALPAPTNISLTYTSPTCFQVSWVPTANAVSYTAKLTTPSEADKEETVSTSSAQFCDLTLATQYNATVLATYNAAPSAYTSDVQSLTTAPYAPTLTFASATESTISLSWGAVGAVAYYVKTTNNDDDSEISFEKTDTTSITISDLQAGTVYKFQASAENEGGNSTLSVVFQQTTVPAAVEDFTAVTQDVQNDVTFSWSSVVGAETYGLTVTLSGSTTDSTNQTGTSWTGVKGLNAGEIYDIRIIAYSFETTIGLGSLPTTISFTTAPPTPTGVSIESITGNGFVVTYDSSNSATLYEIKIVDRLTDGSDGVFSDSMNSSATSQTFTSLSPGNVYAVTVRAQNSGGWSLYSNEVLQITVPDCSTLNLMAEKPVQQTSFRLNWDAVTGASTYELTVNDGASNVVIPGHRVESLSVGNNYTVSLLAKTSEVNVGSQQSCEGQINITTAPEDPTVPTAIARNATSLEFGWKESTGASLYIVEVVVKDSGLSVSSKNVTTNQTSFTELTSGTQYTVKITAVNSFASSGIISGDFWTLPLPPDFAASDVTLNSMVITWPGITNTVTYSIFVKRTIDNQAINIGENLISDTLRVAISELQPGTNYTITMATVGQGGNSDQKHLIQITLPLAPTVTLVTRTIDTLGYSWDPVTGADNYSIEYSVVVVTGTTSDVTTGSSFDIKSLQAGTSYSVTIYSVNDAGSNSAETVQHSTVISEGPDFTVSDTSSTGFEVTITDVSDRVSFDVNISPGESSFKTVALSGSATGLSSGSTYSVSVVVNYDIVGISSPSATQNVTTLNPAIANFVVLTNTQDGGIVLQWDEISTATSYFINVTPSSGPKDSITANSSPQNVNTTLGLTYNFTIQAENSAGVLGLTTELTNIAAAKPKEFVLEITLNSTYIFSDDLKNTSSDAYKQLKTYIEDLFSQIFGGVPGFVKVSFVGAFRGSVVIRVDVEIDNPSTAVGDLITAFSETSVDKSAFNETVENLTPNLNECLNEPSVCHKDAICTNTDDSYTCACKDGFEGDGTSCSDIDECTSTPCQENANCANTIGSYTCSCKSGFKADGAACSDIDECDNDSTCNGNSTCSNNIGGFVCGCPAGYEYYNIACIDVDECDDNPCKSNSNCVNVAGSYSCPCVSGYTDDGRTSCSDTDECNITPSSCTVNQTCDNTIGSFSCHCKSGYAENSDKTDCLDVDECATTNSCHENASCANNIGSYSCSCKVGYTGNGTACDDVDECLDTSACGENEMCKNTMGSFNCPCLVGYSRDNASACVDVNECEDTGICGDNSDCTNTDGSFNCKCSQGYISDGASCVDDNECAQDADNCTDRAECENTIGSFICYCKTGYTGSNNVCDDIDECSSDTSLCNSIGQCYNTIGSYRCDCSGGYEIVGVNNCVNIDECNRTPNCPSDRVCQDTVGSYGCICKTGYTGEFCLNGTTCENCDDVNECNQVNDCNTNAICTNTGGSYSCACKEYYEGDGKTCTGNMTRLYISQTIEKYDYTPALSRATINKPELTEEVQDQVELQFPNFIFISVIFSSGSGTSIIAVYVIETAALVTIPVNVSLYYNPNVGDTALFSNDPELAESCSSLNCSNGYCYSYRSTEACACNVGYDLSSNQCNDIDECASGQDTCHSNATCSNIAGSFNCNCKSGYTGSGFDCSDFDECVAGAFTCRDNSTCLNSIGSYNCPCQPGFIESTEGTCVGQCADLSFCNNGGTCVPSLTADTPTCQCPSAYTGDRCQDSSLYRNLAIAFGIIGGVLLVALIVAVIIYVVRKKRGGRDFIP